MAGIFPSLQRLKDGCLDALSACFARWTKPLRTSLPLSTLTDLGKSKSALIAENALLRQQLIVLKRQVRRPTFTRADRILLVLLARLVQAWQQTLLLVQPDTLLRWRRELFRLVWKRKSNASAHKPKTASETIALIRQMATENRLWGAERIRGELLKLGIHVCKRTIQKYMRDVRTHQPRGQKWGTFLHTHAKEIWACDFLQITEAPALRMRAPYRLAQMCITFHASSGEESDALQIWLRKGVRWAAAHSYHGPTHQLVLPSRSVWCNQALSFA